MSTRSAASRKVLLQGLREGIDEFEFSKRLLACDEQEIREGVDLVVAGLLQQRSQETDHAQRLNAALQHLRITRGLSFSLAEQFRRLAEQPASQARAPLTNRSRDATETDRDVILRIWGPDYRERLGLLEGMDLYKPCARLSKLAQILNQDIARIAHFLNQYRLARQQAGGRGRRSFITKQDVYALGTDLRRILYESQTLYTSIVTPDDIDQAAQTESDEEPPGRSPR